MSEFFSGLVLETPETRARLQESEVDFRPLVRGLYTVEEEIDYRPHVVIENQGSMGSCQGHSLSSCLELLYFMGTGEHIELSRLFAYLGTQKLDGFLGQDKGSTISGGVKLAKEYGVCREEVMPYPTLDRNWRAPYTTKFTAGAWDDALNYRIASSSDLHSCGDVLDYLYSNIGPVHIGINWSACRFENDVLVGFRRPNHGKDGYHAVYLAGYGKEEDKQGRKFPRLFNSHSVTWQGDGCVLVHPEAIDAMFDLDKYTVMVGLTDMVDIKPRPFDFRKEFLK